MNNSVDKRLIDLNPRFVGAGGEGITNTKTGEEVPERTGVAVSFDCPCGCESRCMIEFDKPLDGGPPHGEHYWNRTGDTFETLTLRPSIQRIGGCEWHGYLTAGVLKEC